MITWVSLRSGSASRGVFFNAQYPQAIRKNIIKKDDELISCAQLDDFSDHIYSFERRISRKRDYYRPSEAVILRPSDPVFSGERASVVT